MALPRVDEQRLWDSIMTMAEIGALPGGGCRRLALTDEDRAGRDLFVQWCREAGCEITVDQVGNIHARRPGAEPGRPAVATGSHLDTQPHGGRFDGIYGVLAGLEVLRSLSDAGIETRAPLEVICWSNEEGARFSPPLTGSSVYAGRLTVDEIHATTTRDGRRVGDELARIGYLGEDEPGTRDLDCFFEAHIEQGPILEAEDFAVGVVTGIQGIRWFDVKLQGMDAHAGTTPMNLRRDALAGAADMLGRLREMAVATDSNIRFTVGRFDVAPNSGSTIPGCVSFNIDLRHPETMVLDSFEEAMRDLIRDCASWHELKLKIVRSIDVPPVAFDADMVAAVRDAARALDYPTLDILSGAGHDAMNLAALVPTAMVFVRCRDGISHNEAEYAAPADLAAGVSVLLNAKLSRAGIEAGPTGRGED